MLSTRPPEFVNNERGVIPYNDSEKGLCAKIYNFEKSAAAPALAFPLVM